MRPLLLLVLLAVRPAYGDVSPWPQFRGPTGQGNCGLLSLPTTWGESIGVAWKTPLPGRGHSSPVHDGVTCWVTSADVRGRSLQAVAIDLASGRILHTVPLFQPREIEAIHSDNTYASPTPVLGGGRLYAHFGTYGTACIDTASAKVLWKNTRFPVEHQGGPGSSPVLLGDLLFLALDGADAQSVVALDTRDGSVRWQRTRSAPLRPNPITHRAFSTPLIVRHGEGRQLISPAADQCHAYDPASGNELWHVRFVGFSTVPCPVASETTAYFCTGFFKPELWAVDLDGRGDVSASHVKWRYKGPVPETPSPLLADGKIFIVSNSGIATCIDAETGRRKWLFRLGGNYSASPLLANGLIYFCSQEGKIKLLDPRGEKPKIVNVNTLEGRIMSSPAVVEGDLLIRTDQALYRISGIPPP